MYIIYLLFYHMHAALALVAWDDLCSLIIFSCCLCGKDDYENLSWPEIIQIRRKETASFSEDAYEWKFSLIDP